ncbi:Spc7-domain-containing protein [Suhomyces tanzawaensis NRRL Y-17324]|uniref:Spc7-domain-containing protein n=1 Tax=Suhomyces tanzawaensis NRRL Y-17324 TaxID=984487 RepID=A0A1E4SR13_9ASCO|nr:Spc7-domain-containing protein [Suhomyces tanzawaensis NRRL Y-17324]ODV81950.1 Spc7-domain-containing protein [Suhomyces tanzawaensis NRRL Y-17324]
MNDKENEDPLAAAMADKARNPSKSILKDNTLPIPANKRRVSFAPEVTLHKFDFVPYSDPKRRKTIAEPPSSQDYSSSEAEEGVLPADDGLELLQDSSDLEEDDSFSKLENEADLVVDSLRQYHNGPESEDEHPEGATSVPGAESVPEEEQTMELTGQFTASLDHPAVPTAWPSLHLESVDNEELTMELTGQISVNTLLSPGPQPVATTEPGLSSSDEDADEESDMELTGTQRVDPAIPLELKNTDDAQEITMDITNVPMTFPDEVTMDITNIWSVTKSTTTQIETTQPSNTPIIPGADPVAEPQELSTESSSKIENNVHSPQDDPNTSTSNNQELNSKLESLKLANSLESPKKIIPPESHPDLEDEEQTMEFTQVAGTILVPQDSAEPAMDLTQVASTIIPNETLVHKDTMKETDESNITENEGKGSKEQVFEPNTATSPERSDQENVAIVEASPIKLHTSSVTSDGLHEPEEKDPSKNIQSPSSQSSDYGSQPMQLTQENQVLSKPKIDEPDQNEANISTESIQQRLITTTTKVPLTDADAIENSQEDEEYEDDNYVPVTLNQFMQDIGIKFYDDLDIDVYLTKRISITTNSIDEEDSKLSDYMRAYSKLELLALYQFSCEELSKNIQEGKKVFSEYNAMIESNNPALFREYYSYNFQERAGMNVKLQLIKDFTRHQSKVTWYAWRKQLTVNLIQELETKYNALLEDKVNFTQDITRVDEIYNKALKVYASSKDKLKSLVRLKGQLNVLDIQKLQELKSNLAKSSTELIQLQKDIKLKTQSLNDLETRISENDRIRKTLASEILAEESIVNNNRKYELEEVKVLNLKFKILQHVSRLHFHPASDSLHFLFDSSAWLKFQKRSKVEQSISFKPFKDLNLHIDWLFESFVNQKVVPSNFLNVQNFKSFVKSWNSFKELDIDVYKLSLKYPIEPIVSGQELAFQLTYYNTLRDYKLRLKFTIDWAQLTDYWQQAKVEGHIIRNRNAVDAAIMKEDILQELGYASLIEQTVIERMSFDDQKFESI